MPNFKPKSSKKIKVNKNASLTLDNQHTSKLSEFFNNKNNKLPELKEKKKKLKKELEECNDIEKKLDIKDEIKSIKKKIKDIQKQKNEYLLENSKYIFPYFEKKKQREWKQKNI